MVNSAIIKCLHELDTNNQGSPLAQTLDIDAGSRVINQRGPNLWIIDVSPPGLNEA